VILNRILWYSSRENQIERWKDLPRKTWKDFLTRVAFYRAIFVYECRETD
ncbi:hypothetical protein CRM22_010915, partial [Opisthorchis felineus]